MRIETQKRKGFGNGTWETVERHTDPETAIAEAQESDKHYQSFTNGYSRVVKIVRPQGKPEKLTVLYPVPEVKEAR